MYLCRKFCGQTAYNHEKKQKMLLDYQKVKVYQANVPVLSDVDFQVDEGELVYIIGKVGSGKSSLLKTIYCEIDICDDDADRAEVLGRDLKRIRRKEIPALRKETRCSRLWA